MFYYISLLFLLGALVGLIIKALSHFDLGDWRVGCISCIFLIAAYNNLLLKCTSLILLESWESFAVKNILIVGKI